MKPAQHQRDPLLGKQIRAALENRGIETPMIHHPDTDYPRDRHSHISAHMGAIMIELGLDTQDDSLADTPLRFARMLLDEVCYGLDYDNFPRCTTVENKMLHDDELVMENGITVKSLCEHHFMPIEGMASVAYRPKHKVLGLSKMNRIVDFFSRRPQVQERLTSQIATALQTVLDCPDVAVVVNAVHHCVRHRGIQDQHSHTITVSLNGCFKEDRQIREEFMQWARHERPRS